MAGGACLRHRVAVTQQRTLHAPQRGYVPCLGSAAYASKAVLFALEVTFQAVGEPPSCKDAFPPVPLEPTLAGGAP